MLAVKNYAGQHITQEGIPSASLGKGSMAILAMPTHGPCRGGRVKEVFPKPSRAQGQACRREVVKKWAHNQKISRRVAVRQAHGPPFDSAQGQ